MNESPLLFITMIAILAIGVWVGCCITQDAVEKNNKKWEQQAISLGYAIYQPQGENIIFQWKEKSH